MTNLTPAQRQRLHRQRRADLAHRIRTDIVPELRRLAQDLKDAHPRASTFLYDVAFFLATDASGNHAYALHLLTGPHHGPRIPE